MMWPRDLRDPWLEGPAVLATDHDAVRVLGRGRSAGGRARCGMSGWGFATCRVDGEPLISTFEFSGAEFYCVVCQRKYGFLEPVAAPETPEIIARHAELQEQYDAERKARKEAEA